MFCNTHQTRDRVQSRIGPTRMTTNSTFTIPTNSATPTARNGPLVVLGARESTMTCRDQAGAGPDPQTSTSISRSSGPTRAQQLPRLWATRSAGAAQGNGWAPVYHQTDAIPGIPDQLTALHWHEEMFQVPTRPSCCSSVTWSRTRAFARDTIGLQFHFEPLIDNVREMAVNISTLA